MADMTGWILHGPMGLQAFWIWLTFGVLLLGIEVFLGTQWMLWSAASAGLVAVACLTGLPFGFPLQVVVFAALSIGSALLTRQFLKGTAGGPDVNDAAARLIGRQAEVLSGFAGVEGGECTGRVVHGGVEWPAVLRHDAGMTMAAGDRVVIERVHEGRLYVAHI